MITKTLPVYRGPRCSCGAARRPQVRTCVKCYARSRWQRRAQNACRGGLPQLPLAGPLAPEVNRRLLVVGG